MLLVGEAKVQKKLTMLLEKLFRIIPYIDRALPERNSALAELTKARGELASVVSDRDVQLAQLGKIKAELAASTSQLRRLTQTAPDTLRQVFDEKEWFLLQNEDLRQDNTIGSFRSHISTSVSKSSPSLEIGPSFNPILPKAAGYAVTIIDHADQSELVRKYTPHAVDVSKIEVVDIVWGGSSMTEAVKNGKFDAVVASHVIEHAPDLIKFFTDCSSILAKDGYLYLLVPDKRFAFDFLQPLSDVAKILGDHRMKRTRHSFESFYRLSACVRNGDLVAWDQDGISHLTFAHGDPIHMRQLAERYSESAPYVDAHENYFTPISFAMMLDELRYLGEVNLELTVLTRSRGCEFLAILRNSDQSHKRSLDTFLKRKMGFCLMQLCEEQERINSAFSVLANNNT